jgi:hypothetical protein
VDSQVDSADSQVDSVDSQVDSADSQPEEISISSDGIERELSSDQDSDIEVDDAGGSVGSGTDEIYESWGGFEQSAYLC